VIKLQVNIPMLGKDKGDIITLETKGGVIIDQFWRNRLNDSPIDNCVTIVKSKEEKVVKETKPKKRGSE
jgi:hypothetical protein